MPIVFAALLSRGVWGQGTSGVFPDPIADRDLDAYADRLEMSVQQRLAFDRFHEEYLEESRVLREGPIQDFLDTSGSLMRTFMFAPDPEAMQDALRALDRINDRIRANDARFFDQTLSVLSEEQAVALPRIRDLRDRERGLGGVVRFITYNHTILQVDLTEVVAEIELSAADRAALEPLLPDYEARLTAAARRLEKETTGMFAAIVKRIEGLNLGADADTRAQRRSLWLEMRNIWSDASDGVLDAAAALADVNLRSARRLASSLTHEGARRLTDGFRAKAYHAIHMGSRPPIDRYTAALQLPDLEPDQAKAIAAGLDTLIIRHDQLAEKMIDVSERMQRQAMQRRFGGGETSEADEFDKLRTERDALNEQALAQLSAILGPESMGLLAHGAGADGSAGGAGGEAERTPPTPTGRPGPSRRRDSASAEPAREATPRRPDPFLPAPITTTELASYRARLGLTDDQYEVLRSLYQGYVAKFALLQRERIDAIVEAANNLWAVEEDSGRLLPPGPAAIARVFRDRRETFAAIRAADDGFLGDIELVVIARDDATQLAAMPGVRRARDRVAFNIGVDPRTGMPFGSQARPVPAARESSLDLVVLFDEIRPTAEMRKRTAPVFGPYESAVAGLFEQRYELSLSYAEQHEAIRADASHARDRAPERRRDVGAVVRSLSGGLGTDIRRVSDEIVALNRATLESLDDTLDPGAASSLRASYDRLANPTIFEDEAAVGPSFRRALQLDDLNPDQRMRIGELFADYRAAYDRLNNALVALDRKAESAPEQGRRGWRERLEQRNAREQIEFQRNELNEKSFRRLRAAITEEQARELGLD